MSIFSFAVGLLQSVLSLLGFAHNNPPLPEMQQDQIVQTVQQAGTSGTNVIASSSAVQPSSNSLKNYNDTKYGFEFAYPSSFTVQNSTNDTGEWITLSNSDRQVVNVIVDDSSNALIDCDKDAGSEKGGIEMGSLVTKGGIQFYYGEDEDVGAGSAYRRFTYAVVHNGYCYQISSSVSHGTEEVLDTSSNEIDTNVQDAQTIIGQIASTFQFIPNPANLSNPNMSAGDACGLFAESKLGDTDASVGGDGKSITEMQTYLGVSPATGTYGPKTQIAYQNECIGGNTQPVSVAGMSKYTDSDFGFSFWYPSSWTVGVNAVVGAQTIEYPGGTVSKQITISSPSAKGVSVAISEVSSPSSSITDASGGGNTRTCPAATCDTVQYFFSSANGMWMKEYPAGSAQQHQTGVATPADTTQNTMGGLHLFAGSARVGVNTIIPLSATKFLVVQGDTQSSDQNFLANTIVATDPSVGVWINTPKQTATIEAERTAYVPSNTSFAPIIYTALGDSIPQEASAIPIGTDLTITGANLDPLGAYAGNGWIMNSHIFVRLTDDNGQTGILWEGGSVGGNQVTDNQIVTSIPFQICKISSVGAGGCPSSDFMQITPGGYHVTISVDGRGTSNSIPIAIEPQESRLGAGGK